MKKLLLKKALVPLAFGLVGVILPLFAISEEALSNPTDTLSLSLKFACPLDVVDLKLVDFDQDGVSEILLGFNSDSARVGIFDPVNQTWVWQSPGFNGHLYTVAAGDRNEDGFLDIVCGGQRSDSSIGYIEVFDGPDFDSVQALSGFDQTVLSAAISARSPDSLPDIFLGTYHKTGHGGWYKREGQLFILQGQNLEVEHVSGGGAVREILLQDVNGDAYNELFLGMDFWEAYKSPDPIDYTRGRGWIRECASNYTHDFRVLDAWEQGYVDLDVNFDALEVTSLSSGLFTSIIGCSHKSYAWAPRCELVCWNETTTELQWSISYRDGTYITDLATCSFVTFHHEEINAVCAAYPNGILQFRNGTDGTELATVLLTHEAYQLGIANLDEDPWVEICVTSGDSLYIYETDFWTTNIAPVVLDIPNQTIAEGESFASTSLDDYVTDPDHHDSAIMWTHWGETELSVDITHRVATITVPNPEWNGAETIWFKACDPRELCNSDKATFTVTAVNDTPVVSDILNQTIGEGESFASISLDNYVTDADDHDSIMIWAHWGETELVVDQTDRAVTITVPNPEWNGADTIWFKACDPGGLCDSNQATFTVTPENDTPVISDIPNQTIVIGESFVSISLDDYVTDVDDHDSLMTWTHWGEVRLLVDITDRVAAITPPNLEWEGLESIWFMACDTGGLCDSSEATFTLHPIDFCLFQNYPNPFNPQTNIRFAVPVASNVKVTIYNILGARIRTFEKRCEPGTHTFSWDGKNSSGEETASGVYLYKLNAGNHQETRKMVLLR